MRVARVERRVCKVLLLVGVGERRRWVNHVRPLMREGRRKGSRRSVTGAVSPEFGSMEY